MARAVVQIAQAQSDLSQAAQLVVQFRPPNRGRCRREIYRLLADRVVRLLRQWRAVVKEDAVEVMLAVGLFQVLAAHPMEIVGHLLCTLLADKKAVASNEKITVNEDCSSHICKQVAPRAQLPRH